MISDRYTILKMVNPAGRIVEVPSYMEEELRKKGFGKVTGTVKEEYFPQYDRRNNQAVNYNIVENIEPGDFLDVKKI